MSGPAYIVATAGTAYFEGIERDLQITYDRSIMKLKTVPPQPAPLWKTSGPFVCDMVDAQFTLWTGQTNAAQIEAIAPSLMAGASFQLWLPGASTVAAFPGFGNWDATSSTWQIVDCTLNPGGFTSMGQKAPRVQLWGYKFDVHFSALGGAAIGGTPLNERGQATPSVPGVPAILGTKFAAHQIQYWSAPATPLPFSSVYTGAHNGYFRETNIALDHMAASDADTVATWFRSAWTPFSLTGVQPFGPGQPNTVNAQAWALQISRVAGYWEGKLELSYYV